MRTTNFPLLALLVATSLAAAPQASAQNGPPPGMPPGGMPGGPGGPPGMGPAPAMPMMADTHYDAAITIRDGALVPPLGADVAAQTAPTAALIDHVAITSAAPERNGIIVSGAASNTTLSHVAISLSGVGKNDFLGIGAGAMVRDHAKMTLDHVRIETSGAVSSAVVAAEGAQLTITNALLTANGGPLPADYKPHIGPGMMAPPPPLGLSGDARTLLAMSNSHTVVNHSIITADGWGALSTDATGGNLYMEARDCKIIVRHPGYGTYADFGAHVVINHSEVESGGYVGIIAGAGQIELHQVAGKAAFSAVMIHSVMGDAQEVGTLAISDSVLHTAGPVLLVKSANATITISGGAYTSDTGILLLVRKNDDANATQTRGAHVPGVHLAINAAHLTGDVVDSDPDHETFVNLADANLTGVLQQVTLAADAASHWTARANSQVVLAAGTPLATIDAPAGVTISAKASDASLPRGSHALPGGGTLTITN